MYAVVAAFVGTALAALTLVVAFVRNDFSLTYVAGHSSTVLPIGYKLSALWSGQEGSLLLWLLVLTGVSTAALLLNRRLVGDVLPWTVPILAAIAGYFALIPNLVASPFASQAAVAEGVGMNASLQNPYMMIHPPLLYLGYVGLTVPFAFAMAALASRRVDERWITASRRWTLLSWTVLGVAILLGAKWAYESIGWGGYYAWDPVENAAFMPWLTATAFLHSVIVQEKKNMLRVWNVVLITLTFSLTLFGTFLTRSGLINSIHSFSQSSIGGWFLAFLAIVVTASTALILARTKVLRTPIKFESLASREAAFLYNNLLLVAFALTMLWGVAFPLVSQAVRGTPVTVGPPYYNFFLKVFGLPLLLLMGFGPLLAWRRSSLRSLARAIAWPVVGAVVVGGALLRAGAGRNPPGVVAYSFSAFVIVAIALEFWRGTSARRQIDGSTWAGALAALVSRNRRRYGGYVSHAAVILLAIGVVGSSAYGSIATRHLQVGQSMSVGGYTATYLGATLKHAPNHDELRGRFALSYGASLLGVIQAGKNHYNVEQFFANAVGLHTDWLRAEDVMLIGDQFDKDGSVFLKIAVNPLVDLIWIAGLVFLLGSFVAMWPDGREQRRLARRALEAPASGDARLALLEERDRVLAALRELEFDHRTGKISDTDYRESIGPLRRRAAATLRSLAPAR
jgi:cytochrome c-type biogenesis protein CcmF